MMPAAEARRAPTEARVPGGGGASAEGQRAAEARPARAWLRALVLTAPIVGFVGLLAFGFTRDPREIPSPLVGRPAPPFAIRTLDGETLRLEDLRGKIVLVNFWATWCYPSCWNEAPRMEAAWRRHRGDGVVVAGLVYQDTAANARDFVRQHGKTFPNGVDEGSRAAIAYGVYGVPETFFVDRDGRIAYKHVGEISEAVLETQIRKLLGGRSLGGGLAGDGRP